MVCAHSNSPANCRAVAIMQWFFPTLTASGTNKPVRTRQKAPSAEEEYIFHHPLPRMVFLLLRKEARGGGEAATSYCFPSNEATKGRSPSGGFAIASAIPSAPLIDWYQR